MRAWRIPFTVAHCSSEDDGHLASELLQPGPGCKGWVSAQYCIYPQELVLQLSMPCRVERLQVMSHNSMVASSMEVMVGDLAAKPGEGEAVDLRKALFASMGNVEWSDNKETGFRGRQLQTVELEGGAGGNCGLFVKLVLRRNHINRANEYNQVSLLGINIFGVPIDDSVEKSVVKPHREDLGFLMYTDADIVEIMNQLEDRRSRALDDGREEYAKKLRRAIKELEESGQELGVQVALKRRAIDKKDFAEAKALKDQIDRDRERIYRENNVSELLELSGQRLQANDDRANSGRGSAGGRLPTPPKHKTKPRSPSPKANNNRHHSSRHSAPLPPPRPLTVTSPLPPTRQRSPTPPPLSPRQPPITPRKVRSATPPPRRREPPPPAPERRRRSSFSNAPPPPNLPRSTTSRIAEESSPANMTSADRKELSAALEVFGPSVVGRALHKNPGEKQEAAADVMRRLEGYSETDEVRPGKMMRAASQLLARLLRGQVWGVFARTTEVHTYLFSSFAARHQIPQKELESGALRLYAELLVRSGDTNERVSDGAEEAIKVMLAHERLRESGVLQDRLLVPIKSQSSQSRDARNSKENRPEPPKQALTRCEVVYHMVKELGDDGGDPRFAAAFAVSAVTHTAAPVRKYGERIALALHARDPRSMRRAAERAAEDPDGAKNRSAALRHLLEEFDRREAKMAS